jgi:hypothetical protein
MKKVFAIAMLGLLVSVSACGPKAQNGGTTVAPPVGSDPATGTGWRGAGGWCPDFCGPQHERKSGRCPSRSVVRSSSKPNDYNPPSTVRSLQTERLQPSEYGSFSPNRTTTTLGVRFVLSKPNDYNPRSTVRSLQTERLQPSEYGSFSPNRWSTSLGVWFVWFGGLRNQLSRPFHPSTSPRHPLSSAGADRQIG